MTPNQILTIEPSPARKSSGPAPVRRIAPSDVALALLVRSGHEARRQPTPAAECPPATGVQGSRPAGSAAGGRVDENAWLKLPKGVAVAGLLVLPFWLAMAALAVWLL
jgi:hypothetical protein